MEYEADPMQNIFYVSGRDREVILFLRTLRSMGTIPNVWPNINAAKFAEWDEELYSDLNTDFEDKVNKLITEGASSYDIM